MNIFVLDKDPVKAARMMYNSHVVKMVLEAAQLLSTAHRILDDEAPDILYKATHKNHPCSIWARQTSDNYMWLYSHFKALSDEYTHRYGKVHLSWSKLGKALASVPTNISDGQLTDFAQAMPDCYRDGNAVTAYRDYYRNEKINLFGYTNRQPPSWLSV